LTDLKVFSTPEYENFILESTVMMKKIDFGVLIGLTRFHPPEFKKNISLNAVCLYGSAPR
jgi:hypothetical protein